MGDESRRLKRRHLVFYLEVYNEDGSVLGHLVDLTTKGIKLVSKEPVETNKDFRLKMELPEEYFAEKNLSFTGHSLWTGPDINPHFYATGFGISGLDEDARAIIRKLVSELGFND